MRSFGRLARLSLKRCSLRLLKNSGSLLFAGIRLNIVKCALKHIFCQSLLILLLIVVALLLLFLVELFDFEKLDVLFGSEFLLILESLPLDATNLRTHLGSTNSRIFLMRGDLFLEDKWDLGLWGRPVTTAS